MIAKRTAGLTALAALLALTATALPAQAAVKVGQKAPSFILKDANGKSVSLSDYTGKVVVLEWTNPYCPFVQRHYREHTMTNLASEFGPQGVTWLAINSTSNQTDAQDETWSKKNHLDYPVLNDSSGKVGKEYGAKTTPDMYIINANGKLVYSGGIDNDPRGDKGASRVNYVKKALTETLAGKPVTTPMSKPYGCNVHYKR